jgi:hypothetical protein
MLARRSAPRSHDLEEWRSGPDPVPLAQRRGPAPAVQHPRQAGRTRVRPVRVAQADGRRRPRRDRGHPHHHGKDGQFLGRWELDVDDVECLSRAVTGLMDADFGPMERADVNRLLAEYDNS